MTELLEQAIEAARGLSPPAQDEIARLILAAASRDEDYIVMSPEEELSFDESIEQEERGEFVSKDELQAFWAKVCG